MNCTANPDKKEQMLYSTKYACTYVRNVHSHCLKFPLKITTTYKNYTLQFIYM